MNHLRYLLENGNTPKGAAISRVIDMINRDLEEARPITNEEIALYNQMASINNSLVGKYNKSYGDASGGYIEKLKKD